MFNLKKVFVGLIALFVGCSIAYGEEVTSNQSQSSWFVPSLTINKHEVCDKLLTKVQETFLSTGNSNIYFNNATREYIPVAGLVPVEFGSDPDVVMEQIDYSGTPGFSGRQKTPSIILGGKKYYLHEYDSFSCGGACETHKWIVSDQILPPKGSVSMAPLSNVYGTIYKNKDKSFWSFTVEENNEFNAYQVMESGTWEKSCSIKMKPDNIASSIDDDIQKAMKALNEFKLSVFGLTRGAGSCGSMGTHSRWTSRFAKNLPNILYKPWVYEGYEDRPLSKYTHVSDTYENDVAGLKDWSLMGLSEYDSYQHYLKLMDGTAKEISSFYQKKFGWDKTKSDKIAKSALIASVDATIRFYMYEPIESEAEGKLRKAILEHRPIDEIKSIEVEIKDPESNGGESMLSLAVLYPEALNYLLSKGLNPDHKNDFGKTPLHYAAQYNQPESVKLLLDAGANPNTKTTKPQDSCFYAIRTTNMTPLHYAARYASPETIKILLDGGAATFITSYNHQGYRDKDIPLDWLNIYTNKFGEEKNPNIPDSMLDTVKEWLKPMDMESSNKLASDYVLQAEKLYQEQKIKKAYILLYTALELQPHNERALGDMSLIGMKSKNYGKALESATELIKITKSDKLKANAYYNMGLICREKGRTYHDGKSFCSDNGSLAIFLKSYKLKPTDARKEAVLSIFRNGEKGDGKQVCKFPKNNHGVHSVYFNSVNWYFLVDADKSVPFKSVSGHFSNRDVSYSPKSKEEIKLTDDLKVERWTMNESYYSSLSFGDWICNPVFPKAFSKDVKVVALYPTTTWQNDRPDISRPYKRINIKLENKSPIILYLYAHNTGFLFSGNISNIEAVYIFGNALVAFTESYNATIYRSGKHNTTLRSDSYMPGSLKGKLKNHEGLTYYSAIDLGSNDSFTLTEKIIKNNKQ